VLALLCEQSLALADTIALQVDLFEKELVDLAHLHLRRVPEGFDLLLKPLGLLLKRILFDGHGRP
jgi:hypothetical protein